MKTKDVLDHDDAAAPADEADHGYVLPLVHVRMPERVVQFAFWGALGATVVAGTVELPSRGRRRGRSGHRATRAPVNARRVAMTRH